MVTPCGNVAPVQLAVELASVPASGAQVTDESFPCSDVRCNVTTVPTGMFCAAMFTVTGLAVLTVKSGTSGLAVTSVGAAIPFTLSTFTEAMPVGNGGL